MISQSRGARAKLTVNLLRLDWTNTILKTKTIEMGPMGVSEWIGFERIIWVNDILERRSLYQMLINDNMIIKMI